jgi:uncharacterized protein (DUF305 family)
MSNALLEHSDNEAVTSLAAAIKSSETEIMRQMREERGFDPLDGGAPARSTEDTTTASENASSQNFQ